MRMTSRFGGRFARSNLETMAFPLLLGAIVAGAGCGSPAPPKAPAPIAPTVVVAPEVEENDPRKHVERLADPTASTFAWARLDELVKGATEKDRGDKSGPNVKALLDVIVEPMAQLCASHKLDEQTRSTVVEFLAETRDARSAPCLVDTLKVYQPDVTEKDVGHAARAIAAMKIPAAAGPLFEVFTKLHASRPKASLILHDLYDALGALADPAWENQCITMLGTPINARQNIAVYKDETLWQIGCANVLGKLRSQNAVEPLLKIVLTPMKADIQTAAINALIKIGKPAIDPTAKLLQGDRADLVEYAKVEYLKANTDEDGVIYKHAQEPARTAYRMPTAVILGAIGREEATQPMLDALAKADAKGKVVIARELLKLPSSDAALAAVKGVYEKTPSTLTIPPGLNAQAALLETVTNLFDASLVPWLVKSALDAKGDPADLEEMRGNALVAAMKLMKASQIAEVDKLANLEAGRDPAYGTIGKGYEKEYTLAKSLLKECGDSIDCHLAKLADPSSHQIDKQLLGIKSAYMAGVLGGPEVREKLLEILPKMGTAAMFVALQVIDRRSPKGDLAIAAALEKMVEAAEATKNPKEIGATSMFKTFIYRLRTRAQ